jgi:hypothetical protein
MSRRINPNRYVTFISDHEVVNPETVLTSTSLTSGGGEYTIATIPESRVVYKVGQELQFGSVNSARAFVKAMNGAAVVVRKEV